MKKTIAVLVAAIAAAVFADTEIVDGVTWSYTKSGGEATVTGATPCVGEMIMPETLGGCPVVAVGNYAFSSKNEITKMILSEVLTTIGHDAFHGCSSLSVISIPYGVTTISYNAFYGCSSLVTVELPDSIVHIGETVFRDCRNLESVKLSLQLTAIPSSAFCNCYSLRKIEIPENVKRIDENAFVHCSAATSLSLPEGLESIGLQAFYQCRSLSSLFIPGSTSSIAENAFIGCSNLRSISVGAGNMCVKVVDGCLVSFAGTTLFAVPSGNELVQVPEGIVSIPAEMFRDARAMKHILLPGSLMTIGGYSFYDCKSLEEIIFPASLVSFSGSDVFYGCNSINRVIFNGAPPSGLNNSNNLSCLNRGTLSYPREYGAEWQKAISLSTFSGYAQVDHPEVEYVSVTVRTNDSTILDVVYRVKSIKPTVKVRALAFKDGVRSFANVVRPLTFIEGTDANIGDSITANQEHKLTWRVSTDWQIDIAKVKFEVLAVEEDLLPLELITIPANGTNRAMEISWNALSVTQVFDALLWLYADGDAGLTLADGVLKNGGTILAQNGDLYQTYSGWPNYTYDYYAPEYIFSKMGFSVLKGDTLTYAKGATRLDLSPSGMRQYAYRWIDAQ